MDFSGYNFECKKALFQGLEKAEAFNHHVLEIEHVAYVIAAEFELDAVKKARLEQLKTVLHQHLLTLPQIKNIEKVGFGTRLDKALDEVEVYKNNKSAIDINQLFECLTKNSTILQNFLLKKSPTFENTKIKQETDPKTANNQTQTTANTSSQSNSENKEKKLAHWDLLDKKQIKILNSYTYDLSLKAANDEFDPLIARDKELQEILEVLCRKKKNNPLLTGHPGVGKSAIAEGLALLIHQKKAPKSLHQTRVFNLDMTLLVSGAKYRGEFEERLQKILEIALLLKDKAIFFIDEIHTIVGTGAQSGALDAANILKPALARGQFRCIGATTHKEYKQYIENDAALSRRFQQVIIDEPSKENCFKILQGIKDRYEAYHGIVIENDAIQSAIDLSVKHIHDRFLPDKALDLIDQGAAKLRLRIERTPQLLAQIEDEFTQISTELDGLTPEELKQIENEAEKSLVPYKKLLKAWEDSEFIRSNLKQLDMDLIKANDDLQKAIKSTDYTTLSKLKYGSIPTIKSQIKSHQKNLNTIYSTNSFLNRSLVKLDIENVVAQLTQIPVKELADEEKHQISTLAQTLNSAIIGQEEAIEKVVKSVQRYKVGIHDLNRPLGSFLFLGTTGVGKTLTAKILSQELFKSQDAMVRFDMSEFMHSHNVSRFIGAPPGYIGHNDGGELTEAVFKKPHSLLLFDEIEKAHPQILDILLQVLDDGRLSDAQGKDVNFCNTFIIMTSNLNLDLDPKTATTRQIREALSQKLRPEFVNRIEEVISFNSLNLKDMHYLIDKELVELNIRIAKKNIRLELGGRMLAHILRNCDPEQFGGRSVRRAFQNIVTNHLSDFILSTTDDLSGFWNLDLDSFGKVKWKKVNLDSTLLLAN